MEKEHKVFLIIGIPCWVITIILIAFGWHVGIFIAAIEIIAMDFAIVHGKKRHRTIYLTKIGIVLCIMEVSSFLYLLSDPSVWVQQYQRNLDPKLLITPDDEYVQILKSRFDTWLDTHPSIDGEEWTKYSTYYNDGLRTSEIYSYKYRQFVNINWAALDEVNKSMIVDWYIQKFIVNWTSDPEVYGLQDYKATPHEILQQNVNNGWSAPAGDDCDGIAVVTVSLLRTYNIQSYLGQGQSHMFAVVMPSNATMIKHGLENPIILDYWSTVHLWVYFDEDEVHYVQTPLQTVEDLYLMDSEEDFAEFYYYYAYIGDLVLPINIELLLYPASFIVAIIAVLFIGFPRHYPNQEEQPNREARKGKVDKMNRIVSNNKSPFRWFLNLFYIRAGNPFRKIYRNEWLNVIITMGILLLPVKLLLTYQGFLTQYTLIYLNLYILFVVMLLDRDVFVRIKDFISRLIWKPDIKRKNVPNEHTLNSGNQSESSS